MNVTSLAYNSRFWTYIPTWFIFNLIVDDHAKIGRKMVDIFLTDLSLLLCGAGSKISKSVHYDEFALSLNGCLRTQLHTRSYCLFILALLPPTCLLVQINHTCNKL